MAAHKVMLVEDDPTMLSLLQTLLKMEGFEVVKLADETPQGILDALHREKPALALIDVHLRGANGLDLLAQIRQDEKLNDLRVIMSSGMDFSSQCLQAGADHFLLKPYMPDELIKSIRQVLES